MALCGKSNLTIYNKFNAPVGEVEQDTQRVDVVVKLGAIASELKKVQIRGVICDTGQTLGFSI